MNEQVKDIISNVVDDSKRNLDTIKRLAKNLEEIQEIQEKQKKNESEKKVSLWDTPVILETATQV